ncbi:MAG: PQQ-binding-like beta-propeller repeat protein [Candidatus Eremiobacteraeota bacterium]|nr:PQQ-binding-like beta-propeller repeat protein [Candidatus Eremiobacteraeota bacterium]
MEVGNVKQGISSIKTGNSNEHIPVQLPSKDVFEKSSKESTSMGLYNKTGLRTSQALDILFSPKNDSDCVNIIDLQRKGFVANSTVFAPRTKTLYASLILEKENSKENFLAAFNIDGTQKWKVPFEGYHPKLVPDHESGVIVRQGSKIQSYDVNGDKNWEVREDNIKYDNLPVVGEDNTVYYTTARKNKMHVVAVKDGKEKWAYKTKNFLGTPGLMVTKDGHVFFSLTEKRLCDTLSKKMLLLHDIKDFLVCLNPDGSLKYEKEYERSADGNCHSIEGPNGHIYYISGKQTSLECMDIDGNKIWEFDAEKKIVHSPVQDSGGNIYIACGDTNNTFCDEGFSITCINENDGKVKWEKNFDRNIVTSPIVGDDCIYIHTTSGTFGNDEVIKKISRDGKTARNVSSSKKDCDGLTYLSRDTIITHTDETRQFVKLGGKYDSIEEFPTKEKPEGTGRIEIQKESVIIGGVKLDIHKKMGIILPHQAGLAFREMGNEK